jgi:Mrp family chromosome partitioning ATPase
MHWLDPGLDLEAPDSGRGRPIDHFRNAAAFRRALVAAVLAAPLAVLLFLMLAPLEYRAAARIAFEPPAAASAADAFPLWPEVRLIGSRDLGRRAVAALRLDARPEFDDSADGVGPLGGARAFLGLAPVPARAGRNERILRAYENRLSVSTPATGARLEIAFRSRNRAFAAAAANKIAALYLEMRGEADGPGAFMIAPAVKPARPILPRSGALLAIAASASFLAALAFGAFGRTSRRGSDEPAEEPMAPPRAVGESPVFVRLRDIRRPVPQAGQTAASRRAADDDADALDEVAARILSARRDGRPLRIVGAGLSQGGAASALMLTLARRLGDDGRSILMNLDEAEGQGAEAHAPGGAAGLRDLLAATASFGEAIRRDPCSRLHVISAGRDNGPIELSGMGAILDALAGAYDFIWLAAPALDADDTARTLAAGADFFVLAAPARPRGGAIAMAEAELRACGARDILVIGAPAPAQGRFGQDAA